MRPARRLEQLANGRSRRGLLLPSGLWRVGLEGKVDFADADHIAKLQRPLAADLLWLVVHKRAIAAAEVFDLIVAAFANDVTMVAADGANLDDDVAIGMPA